MEQRLRELWYLEFVEINDGNSISCQAKRIIQEVKLSPTNVNNQQRILEFNQFEFVIVVASDADLNNNEDEFDLYLQAHVCRAQERRRLSIKENEYSIYKLNNQQQISNVLNGYKIIGLKSEQSFDGRLEYLFLQSKIFKLNQNKNLRNINNKMKKIKEL